MTRLIAPDGEYVFNANFAQPICDFRDKIDAIYDYFRTKWTSVMLQ